MLTLTQFAAQHKVSRQRIHFLRSVGRIPSARKVGSIWLVPVNAKIKKVDKRKRQR